MTDEQLTFPILYRGHEGPGGWSFADLRGRELCKRKQRGGTCCCSTPELEGSLPTPLLQEGLHQTSPSWEIEGFAAAPPCPELSANASSLSSSLRPSSPPPFSLLPPLLSNNAMIQFPAQSTTSVLWLLLVQPTSQPSIPAFASLFFQALLLQDVGIHGAAAPGLHSLPFTAR